MEGGHKTISNNTVIRVPEWKTLFAEAVLWEKGSFHSHDEISNIIQLKVGTRQYYSQISTAISKLIEAGVLLKNVREQGYRILLPNEWAIEASEGVVTGAKSLAYSHKVLLYAPFDELTPDEQKIYSQVLETVVKHKSLLAGGVTSVKLLTRPTLRVVHNKNT